MLSANTGYIGRFFAWWFGELRACVPGPVSRALFGTGDRLDVILDKQRLGFVLQRSGEAQDLGHVDLDSEEKSSAAKSVRKSLREVLAFEMDRYTPFAADEVLFDFRVAGSDADLQRLNVELLVARKSDVDRALELVRTVGLAPERIAGPTDGDTLNLLPHESRRRPNRLVPGLAAAMVVVTLVLAGADIGVSLDRKQRSLELFDARVAELRATTGEAGRLEEKMTRLRAVSSYLVEKKKREPLMVEILDEITRRLPDEHYLVNYSYREGAVQLGGYSDDPSNMLRLLEQSGLLSEVRFAAPVTMDPRVGRERFNLVASVTREIAPK
ncbi:MAG TPA: PilN domain-containing protein [Thermohalobaculum sp.]|nr:PilN domain-containing protein [Thermohalobaculum sp.]